jgi:hypothetical protein
MDVLRLMGPECGLVMVDSWGRIAEAAAPAGPDPAATRSLRNRRLATFLQQLSCRLLISQTIDGVNIIGGGSDSDGAGRKPAPRASASVIICNAEQASARRSGGCGFASQCCAKYGSTCSQSFVNEC